MGTFRTLGKVALFLNGSIISFVGVALVAYGVLSGVIALGIGGAMLAGGVVLVRRK